MEFYKRRGYTVIAPEQLKLEDQIAYMKGCEEIACTMGTLSHLALFAGPGTRLTCLLRTSGSPLMAQMLINHAKRLDFYVADASLNLLPSAHLLKSFLLGPSKHWRDFLDTTGEEYAKEELEWDMSRWTYEYLKEWCAMASTYGGWKLLCAFDNFDFLNSLSTALLDAPLKRENYPGAFKEREAALAAEVERLKAVIADPSTARFEAEIEALQAENNLLKDEVWRFENSLAWKLMRPIRKLWLRLGGRAQSKIRAIVNKRLKNG